MPKFRLENEGFCIERLEVTPVNTKYLYIPPECEFSGGICCDAPTLVIRKSIEAPSLEQFQTAFTAKADGGVYCVHRAVYGGGKENRSV